jgi:ribosome-associated protein
MSEKVTRETSDLARLAVDVASEHMASDIVLLDITGISDFADFFVIMTAESTRQVRSLVQEIEGALEATGAELHHREGTPDGGWMLLDFGDLIIHLFGPEAREFYAIEEAWAEGTEVVRVQ